MAAKYFKSEKNKDKLIDELNYVYDFHKLSSDETRKLWRCEIRNTCRARVHTENKPGEPIVISTTNSHDHEPAPNAVEVRLAISALRKKLQDGVETSTRVLISETTTNISENAKYELPRLQTVSRSITNWRNKAFGAPPLPLHRTGFQVPDSFKYLESGDLFLQCDTGCNDEKRILIFASNEGLQQLGDTSFLGMDGTFKSSPSAWYQLFTIHAIINGSSYPRAFILLPDKTQATYDKAFLEIRKLRPNINPCQILIDFERAIRNSCNYNFTGSTSVGCLFHFCQTIYRKICQLGYKVLYSNDGSFATKIKMFCALAFLPPEEVIDTFEDLCEDKSIPIDFISYFELTYIGPKRGRRGRREEPLYPVNFWNVYSRVIQELPRTNNALEGFHSALRTSITSKHPNIWKLIDALRKEESLTQTKIIHAQRGDNPQKKRKYKSIDTRIRNLVQSYDGNDKLTFLKAIAHSLNSPV